MKKVLTLALAVLTAIAASCRRDDYVMPSTPGQVTAPNPDPGTIKGFFVLNEANMGSNKASLDYFDYTTGVYHGNIFPERNPGVAHELGDVGNDLKIYRNRLWAVINCSNFVRVMDVRTAVLVGTVAVPNCRYVAFDGDFAYVSSYAGPVQADPEARPGKVVKIDVRTLEIAGECTVGYQPEQMVVAGGKLYVANSGGYRAPDYDTTISVIDLAAFTETRRIDTGVINLHRLEADDYGNIWASSRGDNYGVGAKTIVIDALAESVVGTFDDLPANNFARRGDRLYVLGGTLSGKPASYSVVDTKTGSVVSRNFIADGTAGYIRTPYGIAVNPSNGDIIITDARDYVTPGVLHCYSPAGVRLWTAPQTGDIPAHIAFTTERLLPAGQTPEKPVGPSAGITRVLDFMPAAGQFVNKMPPFEPGDTQQTMNAKALARIGGDTRQMISLGGWGGYVVVGFDHTIENVAGLCDFRVSGNAFDGSSEPGVVMVARDANGNGRPDPEEWFEIAGSSHSDPPSETWLDEAAAAGNDVVTHKNYRIVYRRPAAAEDPVDWSDNLGRTGQVVKNGFHTQGYYPLWAGAELSFTGTCLPQNTIDEGGTLVLHTFAYGYADNAANGAPESAIDIDWAVDAAGNRVNLPGVDFIKIYTGVNQHNGPMVGECSTEITGIEDLHVLGEKIEARP